MYKYYKTWHLEVFYTINGNLDILIKKLLTQNYLILYHRYKNQQKVLSIHIQNYGILTTIRVKYFFKKNVIGTYKYIL